MQLKGALNGHTVTHGLGLGPGNNNLTMKQPAAMTIQNTDSKDSEFILVLKIEFPLLSM